MRRRGLLPSHRRAARSRSRLRARIERAFVFLVAGDRGKRIDRHIDYFGGGAVTASAGHTSPLDTKV
jgi:hypothetical protein